jgi:hypothetical protein
LMLADRASFVAASLTPLERLAQRQAALIYGGSGYNYKASRMAKRGRCGGVHRPTLFHGRPRWSWPWLGYQEVHTAAAVLGVGKCSGLRRAETGICVRCRTDGCPRLSHITHKNMAMTAEIGRST